MGLEKGPEDSVVELEPERLRVEPVLLREGVSRGAEGSRLRFCGLPVDICDRESVVAEEGDGVGEGPGDGDGEMRKDEREEFGGRRVVMIPFWGSEGCMGVCLRAGRVFDSQHRSMSPKLRDGVKAAWCRSTL